jgi:hypothetical protein
MRTHSIIIKILVIYTLLTISILPCVAESDNTVDVYIFTYEDDTVNVDMFSDLNKIKSSYNNVKIHVHPIPGNSNNTDIWYRYTRAFNEIADAEALPLTVIGNMNIGGYSPTNYEQSLRKAIDQYEEKGTEETLGNDVYQNKDHLNTHEWFKESHLDSKVENDEYTDVYIFTASLCGFCNDMIEKVNNQSWQTPTKIHVYYVDEAKNDTQHDWVYSRYMEYAFRNAYGLSSTEADHYPKTFVGEKYIIGDHDFYISDLNESITNAGNKTLYSDRVYASFIDYTNTNEYKFNHELMLNGTVSNIAIDNGDVSNNDTRDQQPIDGGSSAGAIQSLFTWISNLIPF